MDAQAFQTIPTDKKVEVTHTRDGITLRATVAGSLSDVGHGLLRGIADVDHSQLLDGAAIWVGFTTYWLKQVGPHDFVVEGPAFERPDAFVTEHTTDLTPHMWVSARQFDVARGIGHAEEPSPIDSDIIVQRSVITMLERGGSGSFVMQRHRLQPEQTTKPDGTRRTGWQLVVPGRVEGEQAEMISVYVGSLIGLMPEAAPFLAMPHHTLLQFEGTRLTGAWLLDPGRVANLATTNPGVAMGDAIFGGLVGRPLLSELFVATDLAQVPTQRRPAPDQADEVIDVAAAALELDRDQVMAHADVIPELQLLRFRNPETRKALVVGPQGGLLVGDDTPTLLSEFLRGGRARVS